MGADSGTENGRNPGSAIRTAVERPTARSGIRDASHITCRSAQCSTAQESSLPPGRRFHLSGGRERPHHEPTTAGHNERFRYAAEQDQHCHQSYMRGADQRQIKANGKCSPEDPNRKPGPAAKLDIGEWSQKEKKHTRQVHD